MSSWRKLLRQMLDDPKPVGYSYDDCVRVLKQLEFDLATKSGTSHRKWRHSRLGSKATIGLLDMPGPQPRVYVEEMVKTIRGNNLIPDDV